MLRAAGHSYLCPHHAAQLVKPVKREKPPEKFAAELLGPLEYLDSSSAVNFALSKLLLLAADGRIPMRDANSLGYLCQLLLQSVTGVAKEQRVALDYKAREERLAKIYESIPALQDVEEDDDESSEAESVAQPVSTANKISSLPATSHQPLATVESSVAHELH